MTEEDKNAKVEDCEFIILAKLPSGHIHLANVRNKYIQDLLEKEYGNLQVFGDQIKEIDFTPVL